VKFDRSAEASGATIDWPSAQKHKEVHKSYKVDREERLNLAIPPIDLWFIFSCYRLAGCDHRFGRQTEKCETEK
jgi:hypothetical protein